ncbi:MAG: replicative DNA helicase [Chlorobi bacterium]|nr:MAG: replicative DNA helicase [Bacteroidota bacterium]KXK32599.1 MAG: replicative DNA helicase [Chlorobi bacterium OLB6]MBE2265501.1 replicative DNA helicase [Flavobacteriales bacterium]MBL1161991.1 replicative DNA helicase [Chlorobiota bacterium]MBW7854438.1 replicative DNA helicase [Candidatus Kapabacteria bacterium]MCL4277904.1 replicative DNA helicase [Ignavibacteria bacterium]
MGTTPTPEQPQRLRVLPLEPSGGRVPPHSTEAEIAVLGAMMIDREAVGRVLEILDADCFYHERHAVIFKTMLTMFERGVTIDLITLSNELQRAGLLEVVGGTLPLTEISLQTVSAANVEHHARIVLERFLKRKLIWVSSSIINDAYDDTTDALEEVDRAEQRIFEVAERRTRRSYADMHRLTKHAVERILVMADGSGSGITGVPTGYTQLDEMLSGFQKSDLIIIAARPSMGKTAFALSLARNAAREGKAVGIFSLEMAAHQIVLRLISAETEIGLHTLRSGRLTELQRRTLVNRLDRLKDSRMYIDDSAGLTPVEFRAKCRRMKSEHNIDVVFVDYMQLMHVQKAESREREISMISHTLKAVAKELDIPVIALSQLNRSLEARSDKRPILSDLRDSGSIEQDADVVMFIHRPDYFRSPDGATDDPANENMAEIIIGKQRNGPTGDVKLYYKKENATFLNPMINPNTFSNAGDGF